MPGLFTDNWVPLPEPWDTAAADRAMADLVDGAPGIAGRVKADPDAANLCRGVFGGSPFLRALMLKDPPFLATCLNGDPRELLAGICRMISQDAGLASSDAAFMRLVRTAKSRGALVLALADLSAALPIDAVLSALTDLADAILAVTVDYLLLAAARTGKLRLSLRRQPRTGLRLCGSGHGQAGRPRAQLFKRHRPRRSLRSGSLARLRADIEPATLFVRLTKRLVGLLQEVTEDGYAYRVDLRLRPDPRATQIAISMRRRPSITKAWARTGSAPP